MRQPDQSDIFVLPKEKKFKGYYKIARHYGWALNTTFKAGFEYVIIVEGNYYYHVKQKPEIFGKRCDNLIFSFFLF